MLLLLPLLLRLLDVVKLCSVTGCRQDSLVVRVGAD
jgi:hypothetical protein